MTSTKTIYEWALANKKATAGDAAKEFGMYRLTIQRRLRKEYGFCFKKRYQQILDANQKELARKWVKIKRELDNTERRAKDIAEDYGISRDILQNLATEHKYDLRTRGYKIMDRTRKGKVRTAKPLDEQVRAECLSRDGRSLFGHRVPLNELAGVMV